MKEALQRTWRAALFRRRERQTLIGIVVICWLVIIVRVWLAAPSIDLDVAGPRSFRLRIDPNGAPAGVLETLPGIGPKLAARIIKTRQARSFRTTDDLLQVKGIGAKKLAGMDPYLLPESQWASPSQELSTD